MESGRLYFDHSASNGNMLFLGNSNSIFRGTRTMMNMEESSKRRPFFSSHEELFDEEYYDEQLPEKKRRLTLDQVHQLEKSFESENKLEPEKKTQLAKKLGLQSRQVAVWFQNRRARWKTKQLERDYDHLKSNYDSLQSDYDSIAKENEKLRSELTSLQGKLQAEKVMGTPISGQNSKSHPTDNAAHISILEFNAKVEDGLTSGSDSTVVIDEDAPQLMDSGDSYFPNYEYPEFMVPVDNIQSEDDGSDDGRSYFADVFATTELQIHEEEEQLGLWVWS